VIERLVNCEVYILCHSSQITVDDCVGCKITIGGTCVCLTESASCRSIPLPQHRSLRRVGFHQGLQGVLRRCCVPAAEDARLCRH
jgi:hypothetical protein